MVTATSRLSFQDCFALMDGALAAAKGTRIKFLDYGSAWQMRLRLHAARRIDRRDNAKIYPIEHPLHGHSIYDEITCRIRPGDGVTWLRLEKTSMMTFDVEEIPDNEVEPETIEEEVAEEVPPVLAAAGATALRRRF